MDRLGQYCRSCGLPTMWCIAQYPQRFTLPIFYIANIEVNFVDILVCNMYYLPARSLNGHILIVWSSIRFYMSCGCMCAHICVAQQNPWQPYTVQLRHKYTIVQDNWKQNSFGIGQYQSLVYFVESLNTSSRLPTPCSFLKFRKRVGFVLLR